MSEYKRFYIETSGLCIEMNAKYRYVYDHCREYMSKSHAADISVSVTDEAIQEEAKLYGVADSEDYCEDICLYRAIAERLPMLSRFVFLSVTADLYSPRPRARVRPRISAF